MSSTREASSASTAGTKAAPYPLVAGHGYHGQDAVGVPQASIQGQLPKEYGIGRRRFQLPGAEQDANGQSASRKPGPLSSGRRVPG